MLFAPDIELARTVPAWIERDGVEIQNPAFLALEAKARRLARRAGLTVEKCRIRDPDAYCFGGYMLIHPKGGVIAGGFPTQWGLDLGGLFEALEDWLEPEPRPLRLVPPAKR